MTRQRDFLDEIIEERTKDSPRFPQLVEAALERRRLLRELASAREAAGISQTLVAAKMGTSQSAVARIETGETDVRMSTVERYAAAVGSRVTWSVSTVRSRRSGRAAKSTLHPRAATKKTPRART